MPTSRAWTRATTPPAAAADLVTANAAITANATAISAAIAPGTVAAFALFAPPTGWLKANGTTVGSAASGATRANADTAVLFAALWDIGSLAILTSAGAGSMRGASAAADYAANKRMTLPDLRGEFLRGWDDSRGVDASRALSSAQAEMIGPHAHAISSNNTRNTPSGGADNVAMGGAATLNTLNNTGTENRPRNVAMLYAIKL